MNSTMANLKSRTTSTSTISRLPSFFSLADVGSTKSGCSSHPKVMACNYTWTIENFSLYRDGNNEMLKSPLFSAGTDNEITMWRLRLYPNGDGEENKGYLSLFLSLEKSDSPEVTAAADISIINASGRRTNAVTIRRKFKQEDGHLSAVGHKKYISVASLMSERKKLLSNNALTINFVVKVFKYTVNVARPSNRIPEFDEVTCPLSDDLSLLFQNKKFSDVLFTVSDEKFYAHRAILSARSPVFSTMFDQEAQEQRLQMVNLTNVTKDVFAEMLRYIYTGKTPNLASLARDLIATADVYKLAGLKRMCEEQLCRNLTTENAAELFTLADLRNATRLKTRARDFLIFHMEKVKSTEGFKSMARSYPSLMIEVVSILAKRVNWG